jgi:hypothetical protein
MAYEVPTATEFKTRNVDTTWFEGDYKPAIMYLAAHQMTIEGVLNPTIVGQSGNITSETLGDASTTYAQPVASKSVTATDYDQTSYGRSYLRLLGLNHIGFAVLT